MKRRVFAVFRQSVSSTRAVATSLFVVRLLWWCLVPFLTSVCNTHVHHHVLGSTSVCNTHVLHHVLGSTSVCNTHVHHHVLGLQSERARASLEVSLDRATAECSRLSAQLAEESSTFRVTTFLFRSASGAHTRFGSLFRATQSRSPPNVSTLRS